jgi:hypothetical protein
MMKGSLDPLEVRQIEKIWILGAGVFGRRAFDTVLRDLDVKRERITLVDRDPLRLKGLEAETVCADAVTWLNAHLPEPAASASGSGPLIIPAVPLHLAAEWLKLKLTHGRAFKRLPIPRELLDALPNPHPFPQGGGLYTSIATWRCPDDCPAPASHCTHTGKPRDPDLFSVFERLNLPAIPITVIHSRQLAAGVGGYTAGQLWDACQAARCKAARMGSEKILAATICRCHGVIDLFGLQPA